MTESSNDQRRGSQLDNKHVCPEWCATTPEDHAADDRGYALHATEPNEAGFTKWREWLEANA